MLAELVEANILKIFTKDYKRTRMSVQRFFVADDHFQAQRVILPQDIQNQLRRVLRSKEGDRIIVLDSQAYEYQVRLIEDEDGNFEGEILSRQMNYAEPVCQLTLYISLTQREKFEWILQKGTEAGVAVFQPFISQRSLVQDGKALDKKRMRWEKILQEAAEQCGRGRVPALLPLLGLQAALDVAAREHAITLVAWEDEQGTSLGDVLAAYAGRGSLGLFVGPEGGFDEVEIGLMRRAGLHTFSLGPRILRMETAAMLAPALVLYQLGEMHPNNR